MLSMHNGTPLLKRITRWLLVGAALLAARNAYTQFGPSIKTFSVNGVDSGQRSTVIRKGQSVPVTIVMLDALGSPAASVMVNFSAASGTLSASSVLTNFMGTASARYTDESAESGVGITACPTGAECVSMSVDVQ